MKLKQKSNQFGYTLIELSIGLAITSLVIGGVILGVQKMQDQLAINKTVTQISSAVSNIRNIIRKDPNTAYATIENMTKPQANAFSLSNVVNPGTAQARIFFANGIELGMGQIKTDGSIDNTRAETQVTSSQHFRFSFTVRSAYCADMANAIEGLTERFWLAADGRSGWAGIKQPTQAYSAQTARNNCAVSGGDNTYFLLEFAK